jgi:hypothetical protein
MKKEMWLMPVLMALLWSCQMQHSNNLALIQERFAAINQHNLPALISLYSDSAIIDSPNLKNSEKGFSISLIVILLQRPT